MCTVATNWEKKRGEEMKQKQAKNMKIWFVTILVEL